MANKYMKKYSTSLGIKEMQIKTTLRFHLTPVRLTIKKTMTTNAGKHVGEKGTFPHCKWEYKPVQPLWK
jgi:hypothetical protein